MAVRKIFITEISRAMMYASDRAHRYTHARRRGTNTYTRRVDANEGVACERCAKLARTHVRVYAGRASACLLRIPFSSRQYTPVMSYRRHIDLPFRRPIFPLSRVRRCCYYADGTARRMNTLYFALWKIIFKQ